MVSCTVHMWGIDPYVHLDVLYSVLCIDLPFGLAGTKFMHHQCSSVQTGIISYIPDV